MGRNCWVKTLKDTTMDLARCWINEKLDKIPTKCIIYCGHNDLMDAEDISTILDNLEYLISDLKSKNDCIELFVCELVPSLDNEIDVKINEFNVQVDKWATANGIKLLKTNLNYRLGTGEVDDICYNDQVPNKSVTLNRFGVLRLLSIINKQCQYLELSEHFKTDIRKAKDNNPSQQAVAPEYRNPLYDRLANQETYGHYRKNRNVVNANRWELGNRYLERTPYTDRNREVRSLKAYASYEMHHSRFRVNESNYNSHFQKRSRNGCYNCGEFNHHARSCRFDHQLRCGNCGKLGHKSKLCRESVYVD